MAMAQHDGVAQAVSTDQQRISFDSRNSGDMVDVLAARVRTADEEVARARAQWQGASNRLAREVRCHLCFTNFVPCQAAQRSTDLEEAARTGAACCMEMHAQ